MVKLFLAICAVICFALGAFNANVKVGTQPINWISAGLGFATAAVLLPV